MSMRLGYDLKIEQSQKLVMTPELIQAIQILQFNTQELDSYVQEQRMEMHQRIRGVTAAKTALPSVRKNR